MELKRAEKIVSAFRGAKVCVLGDVMLDLFVRGTVSRISPEAPVPVVEIVSEDFCLGGAGNVAHNIASLGGDPFLVSVTGSDHNGDRLRAVMGQCGLHVDGILSDPGRPTVVKSRIIAHNQQMIRVDRECQTPVAVGVVRRLVAILEESIKGSRALLVSDYAKGTVTRSTFAPARRANEIPVLVDPKVPNSNLYKGATIVTPNLKEAERMGAGEIVDDASLRRVARRIMSRLNCPHLLITRGEDGMTLCDRATAAITHIPAQAREVYDVTGAGDTVIATLALARAAGASWLEGATLANHAAGIVVGRLGTATVTAEELLASVGARRGA